MSEVSGCGVCGEPSSLRCSRCKGARYCSRACQVADFPSHKRACGIAASVIEARAPRAATDATQQALMRDHIPELIAAVLGNFTCITDGTSEEAPLRHIPVGGYLTVTWADLHGGPHQRRVRWYDAASLAAELWTLSVGALDRHRHVAGGLLGLVVDLPDLLWAMAVHRKRTGLCVPPSQTPDQTWTGGTWAGLHLQKALAAAQGVDTASQRRAIALPSPSAAASFSLAGLRTGFELPCFAGACPSPIVPTTLGALPRWWTDATLPWERAFEAAAALAGQAAASAVAPCAYYLTEAGCAAGEGACVASHDPAWAGSVAAMRAAASSLLGTGGDIEDDAEELMGHRAPARSGRASSRRPEPNGLASSPAWQKPDPAAVEYLGARFSGEC